MTTIAPWRTPLDGHAASTLFLMAVDGADAGAVEDHGSWLDESTGCTWTRTIGAYGDGQSCDGWHVRDADGEFAEFIAASSAPITLGTRLDALDHGH